MSKESLFVIKPDEKSEQIAQEAIDIAIKLGLVVSPIGGKILTFEEARMLYQLFEKEDWFQAFMEYLTSGEIKAYLTEGEEVIEKTLEVKRQVRKKYARDQRRNAIHSPKTEEDARQNIELFRRVFK